MRKQTPPKKSCFHCHKWMFYGKGVEHTYADGTMQRVHWDCHAWLLRREATLAKPVKERPKEIVLSDVERDVLALWLQLKGDSKDVLCEIARYMHRTQPSVNAALNRCQEKFNAVNRPQLRERALAAGYDKVNESEEAS